MTKTRAEHLKFCKENAYKQYEYDTSGKEFSNPENAIPNACNTMLADLSKHPETEKLAEACVFLVLTVKDYPSLKRFIDGFN